MFRDFTKIVEDSVSKIHTIPVQGLSLTLGRPQQCSGSGKRAGAGSALEVDFTKMVENLHQSSSVRVAYSRKASAVQEVGDARRSGKWLRVEGRGFEPNWFRIYC